MKYCDKRDAFFPSTSQQVHRVILKKFITPHELGGYQTKQRYN